MWDAVDVSFSITALAVKIVAWVEPLQYFHCPLTTNPPSTCLALPEGKPLPAITASLFENRVWDTSGEMVEVKNPRRSRY